jgi:hypothetical protein
MNGKPAGFQEKAIFKIGKNLHERNWENIRGPEPEPGL